MEYFRLLEILWVSKDKNVGLLDIRNVQDFSRSFLRIISRFQITFFTQMFDFSSPMFSSKKSEIKLKMSEFFSQMFDFLSLENFEIFLENFRNKSQHISLLIWGGMGEYIYNFLFYFILWP